MVDKSDNCQATQVSNGISIVVATRNSASRLSRWFDSLNSQVFDPCIELREVIVVDGMSTDDTRNIAMKYGARIINNPHIDAIHAKLLGFHASNGRYVTFLDHDEMLSDPFSLSRKIQALRGGSERVLALSTGYQLNEGSKTSNHYASEFGDPASFFMYRFSALSSRRLRDLLSRYEICQEDEQYFVLGKCQSRRPALVEYVAMGGVLDKSRFCKIFRGVEIDKNVLINGFSQIDFGCTKTRFVVMKNDHVIHETAESWAVVMRKIRWRTINFLSDPYGISASGLRGRLLGRSKNENFRSFIRLALFGLYVVLVIPVALDSLLLSITRRKWGYLMHFVLSFYVLAVVCQSFALRQIKSSRLYRNYDGSSRVGSL